MTLHALAKTKARKLAHDYHVSLSVTQEEDGSILRCPVQASLAGYLEEMWLVAGLGREDRFQSNYLTKRLFNFSRHVSTAHAEWSVV